MSISLPWVDAFPEHAVGDYGHDEIITEVHADVIAKHPIFRGSVYGFDGRVPSPYKYATQAFRDLYDQEGWTGLIFEQVFPLKACIDRIVDRECDWKVQAALARIQREQAANATTYEMPVGAPPDAEVTWNEDEQPTPEQLARYLWQKVIDTRMNGHWLGSATAADVPDAPAITNLGSRAVQILLNQGADPNVLNHLARVIAFETVGQTLMTLEEVDFARTPGSGLDWEDIEIELTGAATRDADANIGGWPPA